MKITALPAAGTLSLDGTAIASTALPKTVTATELAASKLTYTPPTDQIGTVSFMYKVNDGTADSPDAYTMTINVTAANRPATGAPTISGTAQVGQTLAASTTPIDDLDGLPSVFTYQWMRVDADGTSNPTDIVSNATSTTYTLTESEEGKKVKVEVSFTDSGGASETRVSAAYPASGTVAAAPVVNTPPTAMHSTVTTNEETDHTFAAANFSYADSDDDDLDSVKITGLPATGKGRLTLDGTAITSGDLSKTVTAADLTASKLKYTPPTNATGMGYASFKYKVNDGTVDSAAEYTMTIDVNPVNDTPTAMHNTVPTDEDTDHTFAATDFSYSDSDSDLLDSVKIIALPAAGTLILDGTAIASGALPKAVTATELDGEKLTYSPPANANGMAYASFTFKVNDGTADSAAEYTMTIDVNPVNDTPTAMHNTVPTDEDTDHTFAATDFSYSDSDSDLLDSVKIIALPAAGTLILDGTAIASGALPKAVTATELDGEKLTYSPPANANGMAYASFTFKVNDGTADSALTYTMTINVDPVQDAATGAPTISGIAQVGQTLTASPDLIADLDGLPSAFTYQWIRVDADGMSNPTNIGAGSSTYTLTASEAGKKVRVEVSFMDDGGASEGPLPSLVYPASGTVLQLTVQFERAAYTVAEGGTQSVTVTLSADPERTVVIPLMKEELGGAESTDYSGVPADVTFNAGDTSKSFTFTATQDNVDDDGESVKLAFDTPPTRVSVGTTATTTVSIDDDDGAGMTVSEAALTIGEGSSGTYTIVLDSQPTANVTVTINDPPGNTDVTAEPASLTFSSSDWSSQKTVMVNAAQDGDADDETATVTHTVTSTDSSYSSATANSVIVTVTDDDDPAVTVQFEQAAYTVAEGGTQSVTVRLSADPERTVDMKEELGGAEPTDYSGVPADVTFNAGDRSKSFPFTATQDTVDDDGESVKLAFTPPTRVSVGTTATTTVSINDDDGAGVSVSIAALPIGEGRSGTYTIVLDSRPRPM